MWENPIKKEYDMLKEQQKNVIQTTNQKENENIIDLSTIMSTNIIDNEINYSKSDIIYIDAPIVAVYNGSRTYDYSIIDMAKLSKKNINIEKNVLR